MRYYIQKDEDYIYGIGTGESGEEITESRYNELMTIIRNRPVREGYGYKLKTDLTWEEYESPIEPDEPDAEEVLNVLLGGES